MFQNLDIRKALTISARALFDDSFSRCYHTINKGVAALGRAAGPKCGKPPYSKRRPYYFLSIMLREITPKITKQN
jgi:hypothetical protein